MSAYEEESVTLPGDRPANANRRWTREEEAELRRFFEQGAHIGALAKVHGRTPYAIRMRLVRMGLLPADARGEVAGEESNDKAPDRTGAGQSPGKPKLTIELVPETCWFSNVRSAVSTEDWDRIRKPLAAKAKWRCEICGGKGTRRPVECHEVWHYDDTRRVQTLMRMIVLCPACHEVKHMGLATARGRSEGARAHLAKVNGWDDKTAQRYVDDAFTLWERRSRHEWALDISALEYYGVTPPDTTNRPDGTPTEDEAADVYGSGPRGGALPTSGSSRTLADVVSRLPNGGRALPTGLPRVPIGALSALVASAAAGLILTSGDNELTLPVIGAAVPPVVPALVAMAAAVVAVASVSRHFLSRWVSSRRTPRDMGRTPSPVRAAAPSNGSGERWVREGNWLFWWTGSTWSGDRIPVSSRSAWWPDPYGPGVRWWTGTHWSDQFLARRDGWVPVRPSNRTTMLWWDGTSFAERLRCMPIGTRVRPKDRSNIGRVIGVDIASRERPALVRFRNKRTRREATVNFAFTELQKN